MSRESLPKQVDFPDSKTLLEVINIQTEIVKMGVSLGSVMALVCERTQALTQAGAAVVELARSTAARIEMVLHPNPHVATRMRELLQRVEDVILIAPGRALRHIENAWIG